MTAVYPRRTFAGLEATQVVRILYSARRLADRPRERT